MGYVVGFVIFITVWGLAGFFLENWLIWKGRKW